MAEEESEELPPCLWETKNEEGEWGEGTTDEGFPVGEVRLRRLPSNCRAENAHRIEEIVARTVVYLGCPVC